MQEEELLDALSLQNDVCIADIWVPTLNEDAQVRAREGGVGVVDDDELAIRVQHEQACTHERL